MRHQARLVPMLLVGTLLSACAAAPTVLYQKVTGPDEAGAVKFKLAHSMLQVTATRDDKGGITSYDIKSVPVTAAADPIFSVQGVSKFGVDTVLTPKFRPDSDLIQQLTVKVNDQRVAIIQGVTTIIAAVIPLAFEAEAAPPAPPAAVDVSSLLAGEVTGCSTLPDKSIHCLLDDKKRPLVLDITFSALPIDAFSASVLNASYTSQSYVYSACRDAHVKLLVTKKHGDDYYNNLGLIGITPAIQLPEVTVKVADPTSLESLALPVSGTVTAADTCGAQSAPDATTNTSALDIANALVKGAQSIKDAYDKTKK